MIALQIPTVNVNLTRDPQIPHAFIPRALAFLHIGESVPTRNNDIPLRTTNRN